MLRIEAHVIARQQRRGAIAGRVFHRLGGDRRGELLELGDGTTLLAAGHAAHGLVTRGVATQPGAQLFQQRLLRLADVGAGSFQCGIEPLGVVADEARRAGVGAIDLELHDQLQQHPADGALTGVAGAPILLRQQVQGMHGRFEFAVQRGGEHQAARFPHLFEEVLGAAGPLRPELAQRGFAAGGVLHRRHLVHEFVAGGAVDAPAFPQLLAFGEDLLDVDGEAVLRRAAGAAGAEVVDATAQLAAIGARIGQAIDVIQAQAVEQAFADQAEDQRMGFFEHLVALHAQAAQFGDVEEAPPVDVVRGGAPAGQAIVLTLQQGVQPLLVGGLATVEGGYRLVDGGGDGGVLCGIGQLALGATGFFQVLGPCREGIGEQTQLGQVALAQDLTVGTRIDRKVVGVVLDAEGALLGVEYQLEFAGLQHVAIGVTEEGQQHLALQIRVGPVPVDVVEARVAALATPFEDVQPPGVLRAAHVGVVGHEVGDQAHAVFAQAGDQAPQRLFAAQFRVDPGRIDHVIAVHGTGARGGDGRGIEVTDAQLGVVLHQGQGVVEGEVLVELQAYGSAQATHRVFSGLLRAVLSTRRRRSGVAASSRRSAGSSQRRSQLGCSLVVPGRLACSS